MASRLHKFAAASIFAMSAALALPSQAASFSSLTVFGDSLSDTGNVFLATSGAIPAAPYYMGRFSDGPVWIDHLATGLGLPAGAVPSFAGGNNYAFGGARSDASGSPVPGLLAQLGGLWMPTHPTADVSGLYVLVAGGNDMRDARTAFPTNSIADNDGRQVAAEAAVANLGMGLQVLAATGAKNVLISNLPDLGRSIEAVALGLTAPSTDATNRFNAELADLFPLAAGLGLNLSFLDMAGVLNAVLVDALNNGGATFGITNVFTPCGAFTGSIGVACSISGFSDALHPSAAAHKLIGAAAISAVSIAAIPEPQTYALFALGLVALVVAQRRKTQR